MVRPRISSQSFNHSLDRAGPSPQQHNNPDPPSFDLKVLLAMVVVAYNTPSDPGLMSCTDFKDFLLDEFSTQFSPSDIIQWLTSLQDLGYIILDPVPTLSSAGDFVPDTIHATHTDLGIEAIKKLFQDADKAMRQERKQRRKSRKNKKNNPHF